MCVGESFDMSDLSKFRNGRQSLSEVPRLEPGAISLRLNADVGFVCPLSLLLARTVWQSAFLP